MYIYHFINVFILSFHYRFYLQSCYIENNNCMNINNIQLIIKKDCTFETARNVQITYYHNHVFFENIKRE